MTALPSLTGIFVASVAAGLGWSLAHFAFVLVHTELSRRYSRWSYRREAARWTRLDMIRGPQWRHACGYVSELPPADFPAPPVGGCARCDGRQLGIVRGHA